MVNCFLFPVLLPISLKIKHIKANKIFLKYKIIVGEIMVKVFLQLILRNLLNNYLVQMILNILAIVT